MSESRLSSKPREDLVKMECPNCGEKFLASGPKRAADLFGLLICGLLAIGLTAIIIAILWNVLLALV